MYGLLLYIPIGFHVNKPDGCFLEGSISLKVEFVELSGLKSSILNFTVSYKYGVIGGGGMKMISEVL
jgi:hypothetical protein